MYTYRQVVVASELQGPYPYVELALFSPLGVLIGYQLVSLVNTI